MTPCLSLRNALARFLPWNKARLSCMIALVQGIVKARCVNLTLISAAFEGDAKNQSTYRRFQRFFKQFDLPLADVARAILSKIPKPADGHILCMDRTNWQLGKRHINILTVGILVGKVCVPIAWKVLPQSTKIGNSNFRHRIAVMESLLEVMDANDIRVLLMDREFLGEEWLGWLDDRQIGFVLRIKKNTLVSGVPVADLCSKPGPKTKSKQEIWGRELYLSHKKIGGNDGDLLVVSNRHCGKEALEFYRMRWGIELLFSHLKKRGFDLESTHLTDAVKLEKLMAALSLSFLYTYGWGLQLRLMEQQTSALSRKSDFRYGFEAILKILLNPNKMKDQANEFFDWIEHGTIPLKS